MASQEDLYVLIDNERYRAGKSDILNSQADLLRILKHIHHLKVLSRQKADLNAELHRLFSYIAKTIETIEERFPNPKVPKKINMNGVREEKKEKSDYSKKESIDMELESIQEKLRLLNG
ncbi:MAG: hypothetical protein NUV97_01080 [archaeon]|nr:hypothetical protein [archaeon]MCR4323445.1 hypothetical protein [Nanoarchaeota archaeon]